MWQVEAMTENKYSLDLNSHNNLTGVTNSGKQLYEQKGKQKTWNEKFMFNFSSGTQFTA